MTAARFPGPLWAKASQLRLRWHELMDTRQVLIQNLHKQYGPLVQISPNEVSVNDSSSIRQIFAPGLKLDRPEPLLFFHNYGSENVVSTVNGELHQERRKCVRSFYNIRNIESEAMQSMANQCVDHMENYIDEEMGNSGKVNLFLLFRYLGCDFMSRFVYGSGYGLNLFGDKQQQHDFQKDLHWQKPGLPDLLLLWFADLARSLEKLNLISVNPTPQDIVTGRPGRMKMQDRSPTAENAKPNEAEVLFDGLASALETTGPSRVIPDKNYVLSDALDHFWAGVTTTADALSPIILRLSQPANRHQQVRLRKELHDAVMQSGSPCSLKTAKSVSYLECIIREGLRLHSPFQDSLGRKAPQDPELVIHGHRILPGMRIGAQPYSVHRNEQVFSSPEEWKPERWEIPRDSNEFIDMKRHLFAFSAGPRMCIGMNVAWNQLYLVLARIYSRYETNLTDEFLEQHTGKLEAWPDKESHPIKLTPISKV